MGRGRRCATASVGRFFTSYTTFKNAPCNASILGGASESRRDGSAGVGVHKLANRDVQTSDADERTNQDGQDADQSLHPFALPFKEAIAIVVRVVEPEHTGTIMGLS